MTSPDLINELTGSRPVAPTGLRARVREIAAQEAAPKASFWPQLRLPIRRIALVAIPATALVAIASAGVLGLARSDGNVAALREAESFEKAGSPDTATTTELSDRTGSAPILPNAPDQNLGSVVSPTLDRAQRISATLTVEVADSGGVSRAAQRALDLTDSLGGHVVSANVATGDQGSAALVVRVPVDKVQEAIVQLSALGRIVSQQVTIDDLQANLDRLERRERSVRAQIALLAARLESESLDATTRAQLESRVRTLRQELRGLRRDTASTNAEARMATIQLTVVTPGVLTAVPVPSRLDRTLDESLNVLVWEGVIALAIAIIAAPFALLLLATWLGRKLYRRREEDRLLAT
ncbi:MAG: DUF4349 domain-containing protein [Actinomycetota bacterium]|nr:DUF4349 domain-containing protein [Actinomycetota bacterium]